MKSPQDMRIIQIDVTNACIHNCSNCTRFCGHHKKPFFMDVETFKKAVDSMEGYVGTVSMMGGEPTIHPQFEELITYLGEKYKEWGKAGTPAKENTGNDAEARGSQTVGHERREDDFAVTPMIYPQRNFMDTIHQVEMDHVFLHPCAADPAGTRQTIHGPGLWSAMGERYKRHYEIIQDTIAYQALNDHSMPMYHQPALISRKSLGIPDEEWVKLRDNCWIQNLWSACITPKGAFFCEVAGALDMLFDGPGGWPVEPGWWKRTPEQFGDQLHWCELCGLALSTFTRDANEEVDDVSPDIYEKLVEAGSRKVGTKHIHVVDIHDGKIDEDSKASGRWFEGSMPYTESYVAKFDAATQSLSYKKLEEVVIPELQNAGEGDISSEDVGEEKAGKTGSSGLQLGGRLAELLEKADHHTYALVLIGAVECTGVKERLQELVLNPGTLLYRHETDPCEDAYFRFTGEGYALLLSGIASSVKRIGWERLKQVRTPEELRDLWDAHKVVAFSPSSEYEAVKSELVSGKRYVVYGAGETAPAAIRHIAEIGAVCVRLIDGNPKKWDTEMDGIRVSSPEYLQTNRSEYDQIVIASTRYYSEIRDSLYERGFGKEDLRWWM